MTFEAMEFASKSVNTRIFLNIDSVTDLLDVILDTLGGLNVSHLMIVSHIKMICDKDTSLLVKQCQSFVLFIMIIEKMGCRNTVLHKFPGIIILGFYVSH